MAASSSYLKLWTAIDLSKTIYLSQLWAKQTGPVYLTIHHDKVLCCFASPEYNVIHELQPFFFLFSFPLYCHEYSFHYHNFISSSVSVPILIVLKHILFSFTLIRTSLLLTLSAHLILHSFPCIFQKPQYFFCHFFP